MRIPIISDVLQALAEGFDLAFEIMCPRDHSCEYRARQAREAQAAADALADAEAEREAWEANELFDRADQPQCGCGAGYATAAECPWCSEPPDDDEPLTEQELVAVRNLMAACDGISFATLRQIIQERGVDPCPNHDACGYAGLCLSAEHCQIAELNQTSHAVGTQRADSSGEVGGHESPSPERPAEPASTEDVAACIKSFLEDQVDGEIDWMTRIFIDGASDVIAEGLSPHFSFTRK